MSVTRSQAQIGDRSLVFETGKLAQQAGGAVSVRYGDTVVFAAATVSPTVRPGIDFFPLTVDFEERLYAAGKIPGSFPRREGRPSEEGILTARLTDRPIRPLFPKGFRNDVQIVISPFSADQENDPDILAVNAASCALALSAAPFEGPIGCVRVGTADGALILSPTIQQLEESDLDLVVAGTRDAIMMIEAGAREVSEDVLVEALRLAQTGINAAIEAQEALVAAAGKPKMTWVGEKVEPAKEDRIAAFLADKIRDRVRNADKALREQGLEELKREAVAGLVPLAREGAPVDPSAISEADVNLAFEGVLKKEFRRAVLEEAIRPDGRGLKEIRPLSIEVGILPRTHGSALFQRGQTQILSIATLGPSGDEQIIDTLSPYESKRFMHHYNFPPYSVGEVRPLRGAGRREIGHGALAERALLPVIPTKEEFPYTIRVVSETLSSNGSTSMASTCAACLALMDAGVPMKAMIGGISIGLVMEGAEYRLLTDIQGMEDAYGDMDFKVTGSDQGVTAMQLDIKLKGLSVEIMREALQQAREARLVILDAMRATLPGPRDELSRYAPRIETIRIPADKVREVIGPGGKMVRQIQSETGTTIELEDDGTVRITGAKPEGREKARAMIEGLTKEPEVGEIYEGKVTRIMGIGAFVEYLPGKEGLVRISELSPERVNRVEDVVNVGDKVTVKIAEVDRMGRVNLSMRAVTEDGDGYQQRQRAERERYRERDERGGPRRGGGTFRRGGPPR